MFYRQCNDCNKRWELGTASTCTCANEFVISEPTPLTNIWVMKITPDRRIEVNEDVEVTEAAKKVLECMQTMLTKRTWVEIDDEDFSKALELCDFDKIAAFEFFEAKLKEKNT
jgi:hypothetical protein